MSAEDAGPGRTTRYDKLAVSFRGAAVLRSITVWVKDLGDTV